MDIMKLAGGILSAFYDSAGSTYSNLSRRSDISDDDRDTCREYARDMRERRDAVRSGDFSFLFSSDDDDY